MIKVYIASSWKHQHAVELLTSEIRKLGFDVRSWIENNYGENPNSASSEKAKKFDFDEWIDTKAARAAFRYDTHGAAYSNIFIYLGNAGKDAAAECGICYGQKMNGAPVHMYALYAKGEDFGLMRKMFDQWFERTADLLGALKKYENLAQ